MRGFLFHALCCAVLCTVSACTPENRVPDGTLTIAFESAAGTLDPRFGVDAYSSRVRSLVFNSLLQTGTDGEYDPYAAESWACDFASLTCSFVLKNRLTFHDGSALTSADVAATYDSVLDAANGSPKRALLEAVDRVEALDERTVVFHLKHASPSIGEAATLGILPRTLAQRPRLAAETLIGAGPYRLTAFDGEERVQLERFMGYAAGVPSIESIEIRVVPDALMRAMELRHGTVHLVQNAIDPDTVEWLERSEPSLRVLRAPSSNYQYMGMNFENPTLADRRVRRAIALALDRGPIVTHILGAQAVMSSGLLPPEHWAFNGTVRRYDPDLARAMRLLDKAGLRDPDGSGPAPRLRLSYKTTTHELQRRIAEVLVAQLSQVGIELMVRTYEWGTFFADIRSGNFDLYTLQWVGITDPDLYRQIFHSAMFPPAGNNRGSYSNTRMDRLTEAGLASLDPAVRRRIYARVQKLAARDLPYLSLWWPQRVVVATSRLEGFVPHPSGSLVGLANARLRAAR